MTYYEYVASGLANYFKDHEPQPYERNNKLPEKFRMYKIPEQFQTEVCAEQVKIKTIDKYMKQFEEEQ